MKRYAINFLFCIVFVLITSAKVQAQKIYLLPVGDISVDSGLREAVIKDLLLVVSTFDRNVLDSRLVIYGSSSWNGPNILESDRMKRDILRAIESCPAQSSDTIVFYWSGHGAYDGGGQYFNIPYGSEKYLYRNEVLSALKRKQVRLAALISDCCNVLQETDQMPSMEPGEPNMENMVSPLFRKLFFESSGILDVTSCQRNETSSCSIIMGSYFTWALMATLNTMDADQSDWPDIFQSTNSIVKSLRKKQTVSIISLPNSSGGFQNNDSIQWSEAKYWPEIGDRVIRVNGNTIDDEADFRASVKNSPDMIYLELVDHRTGSVYQMRTELWPEHYRTRLGLYVETDSRGGVSVVDHMRRSPCRRCQIPR